MKRYEPSGCKDNTLGNKFQEVLSMKAQSRPSRHCQACKKGKHIHEVGNH